MFEITYFAACLTGARGIQPNCMTACATCPLTGLRVGVRLITEDSHDVHGTFLELQSSLATLDLTRASVLDDFPRAHVDRLSPHTR